MSYSATSCPYNQQRAIATEPTVDSPTVLNSVMARMQLLAGQRVPPRELRIWCTTSGFLHRCLGLVQQAQRRLFTNDFPKGLKLG
jgi:hypothetical protein